MSVYLLKAYSKQSAGKNAKASLFNSKKGGIGYKLTLAQILLFYLYFSEVCDTGFASRCK